MADISPSVTFELAAILVALATGMVGVVVAFIKWALGREVKRIDATEEGLRTKADREELQGAVDSMRETTTTLLGEVRRQESKRDTQVEGIHVRINELKDSTSDFHIQVAKEVAVLTSKVESKGAN